MDIDNMPNSIENTSSNVASDEDAEILSETESEPVCDLPESVPADGELVFEGEPEEIVVDENDSKLRYNEYIYNNYDAPGRKESIGGKIALGIIAALLSVFVISVMAISAYESFSGNKIYATEPENPKVPTDTAPYTSNSEPEATSAPPQQEDAPTLPAEPEPVSEATEPEAGEYPTLEQLASAKDALGLPDIYDKVSPSVVGVSCKMSRTSATGTGIIISSDGYVITNAHVVEDALDVMIVDCNMQEYEAVIIGSDSQTDLAVLKVDGYNFTPCEFGVSSELRIGELAVVIGNPLGFDLYGTMTMGIISGLNRTVTIGDNTMTLIQTQASINRGNSGGPLINCYGQVIGITSAKVDSQYGEGLGFAIPIDEALPILNDLMKYGYVTGRPEIGITGEDITYIMSLYYRLPQGVLVRFVTPDSGADKAGIKASDIIIGIDGETVTDMEGLTAIKNRFSAGDTVTLTVFRDGESMDIQVTLSEVSGQRLGN